MIVFSASAFEFIVAVKNSFEMDLEETFEHLKDWIKKYITDTHHIPKLSNSEDSKSSSGIDYRFPLLSCVYFLIPAITIVILRNWFEGNARNRAQRYSLQVRCVLGYLGAVVCACFYLLSVYNIGEILYGRMYVVVGSFMCLFLILLSYGWRRRPDVRIGVIIAYLGVSMSFLSLAVLSFCKDEPEIVLFVYDLGILVFMIGISIVYLIAMS